MKIITTSWDDGHELDCKVAELLDKYNLKGTFYIPQHNSEQAVMNEQKIKEISTSFEVGGHTLHHTRLNIADKNIIDKEVGGCYRWITNVTGKQPLSFAFPGGELNKYALNTVFNTGFKVARTTELLSIQASASNGTMPTTIQMYKHSNITYFKHLIKRIKIRNLARWLLHGSTSQLLHLAEDYIHYVNKEGGCFHLWGHSWEIEQFNLWSKLEEVCKLITQLHDFKYLTNGDICTLD